MCSSCKKYLRPFLCLISITALSLLMLWMLGAFYTKTNVAAQGLGIYSANINTFWNPLDSQGSNNGLLGDVSKGSRFLKPIAVNFGQYEGYAYVGLGIILGAIDPAHCLGMPFDKAPKAPHVRYQGVP